MVAISYFCAMNMNDLRRDFGTRPMDDSHFGETPLEIVEAWIAKAVETGISESNAMTLSTCVQGRPSSRMVLLKEMTPEGGLIFYTDYSSRKGKALDKNPQAALLFFWRELERQIRIEGTVVKTSSEKSDTYFNLRPLESRATAMVSKQSQPISSTRQLASQRDALLQHPEKIKRPHRWGGYVLTPCLFEFWQGGKNRLHHRIQYQLKNNRWVKTQLAP